MTTQGNYRHGRRRGEYHAAYYQKNKEQVRRKQAVYLCTDPDLSHTGYLMKELDAAYDALERAIKARREWKARAK